MRYILGLSALGLLLLAGTSSAQQPSTSSGASSAPVVQSATSGGYAPASSSRRFGRRRGGNTYRQSYSGSNVTTGPSEVRSETVTGQPAAEKLLVMPKTEGNATAKTETTGTTTQPMVQSTSPTVEQPSNTSNRRRGSRGGLLSRLGSRRGG